MLSSLSASALWCWPSFLCLPAVFLLLQTHSYLCSLSSSEYIIVYYHLFLGGRGLSPYSRCLCFRCCSFYVFIVCCLDVLALKYLQHDENGYLSIHPSFVNHNLYLVRATWSARAYPGRHQVRGNGKVAHSTVNTHPSHTDWDDVIPYFCVKPLTVWLYVDCSWDNTLQQCRPQEPWLVSLLTTHFLLCVSVSFPATYCGTWTKWRRVWAFHSTTNCQMATFLCS